jgi:hypothetical protein
MDGWLFLDLGHLRQRGLTSFYVTAMCFSFFVVVAAVVVVVLHAFVDVCCCLVQSRNYGLT